MDLKIGYAVGLFAGAGTSTPTLQAAIATLGNDDPAVGYSVAYPVGVVGPILLLYLAFALLKPAIAATTSSGMELLEVGLKRQEYFGRSLRELTAALPAGVQVVAVAPRPPERARLPRRHPRGGRRAAPGRPDQGGARPGAGGARRGGDRPPGAGSPASRLCDGVRVPACRGGSDARRSRAARREGFGGHPRPPRRRRSPGALGPRARVRRSRRPAGPSRRLPGHARVLRRLDQGHGRVQLHLHRARDGARVAGRRDQRSHPRGRQDLAGAVRAS